MNDQPMKKGPIESRTENQSFRLALRSIDDMRRTLDTRHGLNWVSMYLSNVEYYVAQGWLECRGIEKRAGPEAFQVILAFQEKAPEWLSTFYSTVKAKWSLSERQFMASGDPNIDGKPLPIEEFTRIAEGYFENAVTLFEQSEQSALSPVYEPVEPLTLVDNRKD